MSEVRLRNNIKFYRRLNDLRATQLGAILGRSSRSVRNMEQGIVYPSVEMAYKVSKLFNVPMDELFFEEGNEPEKRLVFMNK